MPYLGGGGEGSTVTRPFLRTDPVAQILVTFLNAGHADWGAKIASELLRFGGSGNYVIITDAFRFYMEFENAHTCKID